MTRNYVQPALKYLVEFYEKTDEFSFWSRSLWTNVVKLQTHLAKLQTQGELPYEKIGDARRKFWIKPLKETNLGVVQALFDP